MKKKILTLSLVAALAVTAIGGTLAYFSDDDAQTNTFTTGNVKIDLYEDFGDNDTQGIEELIPATGSAQKNTLENGIEKEVYVENTGSEDAYVRVHIAIPAILDDAQPNFEASKNVLHFNYAPESVAEGKWNWTASVDGVTAKDGWNYYTTKIDNVDYNVYVVTYETALKGATDNKTDTTCDAMSQVYLDSKTTNDDISKIKKTLGESWHIYVVAEGTQAAGFGDAYEALNEAFGIPGQYTVEFKAEAENEIWVDVEE